MRDVPYEICSIKKIPPGHTVLDIPEQHVVEKIKPALSYVKRVLLNGTAGLYEVPPFNFGTEALINLITVQKNLRRFVIGGNSTEAVLKTLGQEQAKKYFEFLFTMGGAALEYLPGEEFPGQKLLALQAIEIKSKPIRVNGVVDYSCLKTIMDIDPVFWQGKTVDFISDLNVGNTSGVINPYEMPKIEGIVASLAYLLNCGVRKINILAHNGRYKDYSLRSNPPYGYFDPEYSLRPLAPILTNLLRELSALGTNEKVVFVPDCLAASVCGARIELKENTRFYLAETAGDTLAKSNFVEMLYSANKANITVNDAAGALHRGDCSKLPLLKKINGPKVVGLLVQKELGQLYDIASNTQEPLLAIFQGNKDDKIPVIENFIEKKIATEIAILGKIALPFVHGNNERTAKIIELAKKNNIGLILPEQAKIVRIPDGITEEKFIKYLKAN